MQKSMIVAGIGASAGGVEALCNLFREVQADAGICYIVLLHLDPDHGSRLTQILDRECPLEVVTGENGACLVADRVYVVPPGVIATVTAGALVLGSAVHATGDPRSVDVLFSSIAQVFKERAIGVVLSGFGNDGTIGIKAIKEEGGLTIAQGSNGTSPGHSSMPSSAIAGGLVDFVLPAGAIAGKLALYAGSLDLFEEVQAADPASLKADERKRMDAARAAICEILLHEIGHDFSAYKEKTFMRRVHRRMHVLHAASLDAYVKHLRDHHEEAVSLLRDLLISVTAFFRDDDTFTVLADEVIPNLFAGKGAGDMVRVWVPGCATGEEAFSIAMMLLEHAGSRNAMPRLRVFATDIDEAALMVARVGRYPASLLENMSPARRERFFDGDGPTRTITKEVRDICVFSSHSLIRDPPFSQMDLISCRNLLIYLDARAQREIFPLFHFALRPGGHLLLGGAESAVQFGDLFAPINKHHRIYRRRDDAATTPYFAVPRGLLAMRGLPTGPGVRAQSTPRTVRQAAEAMVLDRFAPPHVVVNRNGAVVHFSAHTSRYLEAAPGEPTRSILALARPWLRLDIRSALDEALRTRVSVTRVGMASVGPDGANPTTVTVTPLPDGAPAEPLFLIAFTNARAEAAEHASLPAEQPGETLAMLADRDLRDTRERLQTVIEEYETAVAELRAGNEELISVNEELQSANEELETSKEEQQSINEELQLLNQELKAKLEQLDRAMADLNNMFEATQVATITLDSDLAIRSFTPAIASVFNLRPSDLGRPLTDIAGAIDMADILQGARQVLADGKPQEHSLERRDGTAQFLLRLVPYRVADGTVDGVLAAFVDVTQLANATRESEQQRVLVAELNHRVGNILTVVIALTRQTLGNGAQMREAREALVGRMEALAKAYTVVSRELWREISLFDVVSEQLGPHLPTPERGLVSGPVVRLVPSAAVAFGLVINELATNAVKYGALSNESGSVTVSWSPIEIDGQPLLNLRWEERGGPAPLQGVKTGFGTQLLQGQVSHTLDGSLERSIRPDGYSIQLRIPIGVRSGLRLA